LKLPLANPWALLLGAPLIAVLQAVEAYLYYPRLLESGQLPIHADSIGIPIGNALIAVPFFLVILALWAVPALYGVEQRPRLLAWRRRQPLRSALGTLFYGGAALWMGWETVETIANARYGFDLLLLITPLSLLFWNVALQAVCVDGRAEPEVA
jgi:hypothetical protein